MEEWKPETPRIYREGLIDVTEAPGFVVVPHIDMLAVNRQGELLDLLTFRPKKTHIARSTGGYHRFWHDSSSYSRHHVVCSTFLVKPRRDVPLVVNHRDGVAGHDWLDNLEWVTYTENSLHAVYTGLKLYRAAVAVKDHLTGLETQYPSMNRCAAELGIPEATVAYHFKNKARGRLLKGQYQLKLATEEWVAPIEILNPRSRDDNVAVVSISYSNGQIAIFESMRKAALELHLSEDSIGQAIRAAKRQSRLATHDNYIFFYRADVSNDELLELSDYIKTGRIQRVFLNSKHKGLKVTDLVDGTTRKFRNQHELGKHWQTPAYEVSRILRKNFFVWQDRYKVEFMH